MSGQGIQLNKKANR